MATVNKQDYFQGALDLLAKEGFGALRLTTLCRSIGMTTGSFYNWFRDWDDFVDQFLVFWETELTQRLVDEAKSALDPAARLDRLRELARVVPHDAEVGLRAWSNADPRAARVRNEVDAMRREIIFDTVHGLVADVGLAKQLSILGLSIVVGHQHLDVGTMDWSLGQFNALVRFHADIAR
ncbi:MAG TPA: TetR/AcrR family transcriptional regulator [Mycobacterium sp.]|nr:TetR/AcrR family transcriptional regulator [Mycobacterium sp.]